MSVFPSSECPSYPTVSQSIGKIIATAPHWFRRRYQSGTRLDVEWVEIHSAALLNNFTAS